MAKINPKKIWIFFFFLKCIPAKAEMFMTVNIATKKVAFDRFENVEAVDVAA